MRKRGGGVEGKEQAEYDQNAWKVGIKVRRPPYDERHALREFKPSIDAILHGGWQGTWEIANIKMEHLGCGGEIKIEGLSEVHGNVYDKHGVAHGGNETATLECPKCHQRWLYSVRSKPGEPYPQWRKTE